MGGESQGGPKERERDAVLVAFGEMLNDVLRARGMSQAELAQKVGVTQSMVSVWRNGVYEPPHKVVYEIERILDVSPGTLSRCLGCLPVDAGPQVSTVNDAVLADELLPSESKHTMLALYRHLVESVQPPPVPKRKRG